MVLKLLRAVTDEIWKVDFHFPEDFINVPSGSKQWDSSFSFCLLTLDKLFVRWGLEHSVCSESKISTGDREPGERMLSLQHIKRGLDYNTTAGT